MNWALFIESFYIAFREMSRHRTRSFLTMFGVIIGVGAIISVVSISQGAKKKIQGQIANLGSNMIIGVPGSTSASGVKAGTGSAVTLTTEDTQAIERECSAVSHCAPVARIICQAVSELGNWPAPVTGANCRYTTIRSWGMESGRELEPADDDTAAKVCLIGKTTSEQLFGDSDPVGQRIRLKGTLIEVVGLLQTKGQNPLGEDQDDTVVVPLNTFFRHLAGGDRPQAFVASAVDENQIDLAITQIKGLLRQRHRLGESEPDDFIIKSVEEYAEMAENTSNVMTALLVSIAAISLLVGGIGIMNIMLVTVMERTREIGIRMAVGATQRMILSQFIIESATLAGVGGVLGVLTGFAGSIAISNLTGWPAIFSVMLIGGPFGFAVAIGLLFGLLPARRASSLKPVESLRHD
jgi:putative ABC transport system permease protein